MGARRPAGSVRRGRFVNRQIAASYRVTLIGIASAQLSEACVSQRVHAGGRDVPPERKD